MPEEQNATIWFDCHSLLKDHPWAAEYLKLAKVRGGAAATCEAETAEPPMHDLPDDVLAEAWARVEEKRREWAGVAPVACDYFFPRLRLPGGALVSFRRS